MRRAALSARLVLGLTPVLLVTLVACPPANEPDASADASADAGRDAGPGDAGSEDIPVDAGRDAALSPGDLVWLTTGGGLRHDRCHGSATASDGTIVALCESQSTAGTTWGMGSDHEVPVPGVDLTDVILLGLDPASGVVRWDVLIGSDGADDGFLAPLTALADGRVAALVQVGGPVTTHSLHLPYAHNKDLLLFTLTAAGDVDDWQTIARGDILAGNLGWHLGARPNGGLIISGHFATGIRLLPGRSDETALDAMAPDISTCVLFLTAYLDRDRVLTLGSPGQSVNARAVESAGGGLLLAGSFSPSMTLGHTSPRVLVDSEGMGAAFVAKLDASDEPVWAIAFGSAGRDHAQAVVETADGSIVVTGHYGDGVSPAAMTVPGLAGVVLPDNASNNGQLFVLVLSSTGTPRWLQGFMSEGQNTGWSVSAFANSDVVVAGAIGGGATASAPIQGQFSDGESVTLLDGNALLVRYRGDTGARVWSKLVGPGAGYGAQVRADGNVVRCGEFGAGAKFDEGRSNEVVPTSSGEADGFVGLGVP